MPIYEFVCQECDHEFEKILSFSSSVTPACPSCGGAQVVRQIGRPAIHFKGSGWYITDSKSANKGAKGSANGGNGKGTRSEITDGGTSEGKQGETDRSESKSLETNKASDSK